MKKKNHAAQEGANEEGMPNGNAEGFDNEQCSCEDAEMPCDETCSSTPVDTGAQRLTELNDRYLRLFAEFDNYRKRTQKEKEAIYSDCVAKVTAEWLPVIDNLTRASEVASRFGQQVDQSISEGIELVLRQASDVLSKLGVEAIGTVGCPFDPSLHEAVMHVEQDGIETGTVVEEFQKGYRRGDRVIRHSMVKVAN